MQYEYRWRRDVQRNPTQLPHNRQAGKEHPPERPRGNVCDAGPDVWIVYTRFGPDDQPADVVCIAHSFEGALNYLRAEYSEYRYRGTYDNVWVAERYMGGSGPLGTLEIVRRRTRP